MWLQRKRAVHQTMQRFHCRQLRCVLQQLEVILCRSAELYRQSCCSNSTTSSQCFDCRLSVELFGIICTSCVFSKYHKCSNITYGRSFFDFISAPIGALFLLNPADSILAFLVRRSRSGKIPQVLTNSLTLPFQPRLDLLTDTTRVWRVKI